MALAKRLVAQDEMLFSRGMRKPAVRCALAKRYFRTRCRRRQATGARGGAGQLADPASQILLYQFQIAGRGQGLALQSLEGKIGATQFLR
ncbi:MAG: hypothetical protein AUG45_09050 [Ktedonobacter sp. 13_1_20CM_3_54_15]|nr:MAG: hypothetical protein AUH05_09250 [Ktedonobacter sp. 13_2_20CM_53_11]OLB54018.1 MAG: hypothetical protein AUI01_10765 [Ktedonobacter sp. 13_2_20CM_2_56_8]OLE03035.1 MAG: hypothetical protein AUG82_07380 [Ktedonobacter sp. 13_1_20CM_4_53_11]OLE32806.1 MAG: hypothetical protein AUG45_09050 [Ktedonobacter sp. 13_1_20CM_3_54_15]